jgi:hypothetical protein
MTNLSKQTIFNLLLKREGDSFELGKYYFASFSPDEKEEMKKLLNETSLHYFYAVNENGIERSETK